MVPNDQFNEFFDTLAGKLIAEGDYNAKHLYWGQRIINPKGNKAVVANRYRGIDFNSTYWPDIIEISDLLDLFITKGITSHFTNIQDNYDLSSDHSPLIHTLPTTTLFNERKPSLHNSGTD